MSENRSLSRGFLVVAALGLLSGYALGAQESMSQNRQQSMPAGRQMSQAESQTLATTLVRTDKLIGKEVKDSQGQTLGKIENIVLAPNLDQVSYIALKVGGTFGMGGKYYAVPWSALREESANTYVLSITKAQLDQATPFNEDRWPAEANPQFASHEAGMTPSSPSSTMERAQQTTSAAPSIKERRVTMLTGMDVKDSAGEDVGNVEGFVVDLSSSDPDKTSKTGSSQRSGEPTAAGTPQTGQQVRSGRLIFTVVSFGGIVGIGEKYSLVPSNLVNLQPTQHMATLNATQQALEAMAFAPDKFPNLENREYVREVYQNFGEQPYWSALGYVSPGQQQQADAQSAWAPGSDYNKQFNAEDVETIKGTVESVGTFEPHRGVREGLRLRVKMDSGRFITVHAGPQWYAQQQGFSLKSGDQVTITGSRIKHHMRTVLMATEIHSDGKTLQLRSKTGEPLWQTQGRSGQMSPPSSRSQTPNP